MALAVWLAMFLGYLQLPSRFDPLTWHIHEMLFGFVMAAVAGFLLTAIPNWTSRLPVRGCPLALLAGLWLLGRIACLISADLPAWLAIAADLSFPVVLFAVAAREIIAGRNWRNLPMTAPVAVFIIADLLMHLECSRCRRAERARLASRAGGADPADLGDRRSHHSELHAQLADQAPQRTPAGASWRGRYRAIGVLHAGLILWAVLPDFRPAGVILVIGAALNAWRLARWAGGATVAEPLLLILHVGYGWMVAGTALLGLSILDTGVPVASAIHALTAGAIGTMILAVMPRVTLGHTGRDLTANRATVAIFVLINAAAVTRVAASWQHGRHDDPSCPLLAFAGSRRSGCSRSCMARCC